jgi:hypothetical protein
MLMINVEPAFFGLIVVSSAAIWYKPVPDRWAQTSLLNSCFKQISVKNAKNKKDVTVKVYARYHKEFS